MEKRRYYLVRAAGLPPIVVGTHQWSTQLAVYKQLATIGGPGYLAANPIYIDRLP